MSNFFDEMGAGDIAGMLPIVPLTGSQPTESPYDIETYINNDNYDLGIEDNKRISEFDYDDDLTDKELNEIRYNLARKPSSYDDFENYEEGVIIDKIGDVASSLNHKARLATAWRLKRKFDKYNYKANNATSSVMKIKYRTKAVQCKEDYKAWIKRYNIKEKEVDKLDLDTIGESVINEMMDYNFFFEDEKEKVQNPEPPGEEPDTTENIYTDTDKDEHGKRKKFDTPETDHVVDVMQVKGKIKPDGEVVQQSDDAIHNQGKSEYDRSDMDALDVADYKAKSRVKTVDELIGRIKEKLKNTKSDPMKATYITMMKKLEEDQEKNIKKNTDEMQTIVNNAVAAANDAMPDDVDARQAVDNNAPVEKPDNTTDADDDVTPDDNTGDEAGGIDSDTGSDSGAPEGGPEVSDNSDEGTGTEPGTESAEDLYLASIDSLFITEGATHSNELIREMIDKLTEMGYETTYSSPGYFNKFADSDHGSVLLPRIIFKKEYEFTTTPDGWKFDNTDGKTVLTVDSDMDFKDMDENTFKKWQNQYLAKLAEWTSSCSPTLSEDDDKPTKESSELDDLLDDCVFEAMMDVCGLDVATSLCMPVQEVMTPEEITDGDFVDDIADKNNEDKKAPSEDSTGLGSFMNELIDDQIKQLQDTRYRAKVERKAKADAYDSKTLKIVEEILADISGTVTKLNVGEISKQIKILERGSGLAPYVANGVFNTSTLSEDNRVIRTLDCDRLKVIDTDLLNKILPDYADSVNKLIGSALVYEPGTLDRLAELTKEINKGLEQRKLVDSYTNVPYSNLVSYYVPVATKINDANSLYTIMSAVERVQGYIEKGSHCDKGIFETVSAVKDTYKRVIAVINDINNSRLAILKNLTRTNDY